MRNFDYLLPMFGPMASSEAVADTRKESSVESDFLCVLTPRALECDERGGEGNG